MCKFYEIRGKFAKLGGKETFPEMGGNGNELKQGNKGGNSKFVVND